MKKLLLTLVLGSPFALLAQTNLYALIDKQADAIEQQVITWRRDIHQNPELSNREFKTAEKVAAHLKSLGIAVETKVALTGVVGILKGDKPGPVVALRADMDALPVVERVNLPFASKVKSDYRGEQVGVMHACGHDTHVAMLMGAASVLASMKKDLPGTVIFLFQPAEEGAPPGEKGGAKLMVEEGVLKKHGVSAVFGIHIGSANEVGTVRLKAGSLQASADRFVIKVKGKQTHGSMPWGGIDPVTVSAQIVLGLQNIVSRQVDISEAPVVISVGKISGGVRNNIIPEEVELEGTIRCLDPKMQDEVHARMKTTAVNIAESAGATAEVEVVKHVPITANNPALTQRMGPTLKRVAGEDNVIVTKPIMGAEDFSFFANEVPGVFMFLGGMKKGQDPRTAPPHHTPDFYIDESGMKLGVRLHCNMALDYLREGALK
jgi:amidohydrolase